MTQEEIKQYVNDNYTSAPGMLKEAVVGTVLHFTEKQNAEIERLKGAQVPLTDDEIVKGMEQAKYYHAHIGAVSNYYEGFHDAVRWMESRSLAPDLSRQRESSPTSAEILAKDNRKNQDLIDGMKEKEEAESIVRDLAKMEDKIFSSDEDGLSQFLGLALRAKDFTDKQ